MITVQRPRILVVSSDVALQARIMTLLIDRYELVGSRAAERFKNIALAVVDEHDLLSSDAPSMPWPVVAVRTRGEGPPPAADGSVRASFEPEELFERI